MLTSCCWESFTLWGRFHLEIEDSAKEELGMFIFSCRECTFSLLKSSYDSYETLVSNLGVTFFGTGALENSRFLSSLFSYLLYSILNYLAGVVLLW